MGKKGFAEVWSHCSYSENEVVKLSCNEAILLTTCLATKPHCLDTAKCGPDCHGQLQPRLLQAERFSCLDPPFTDVPDDEDWYCPQCKTDVLEVIKAGEKLRLSKKKAKMVSKKQETNRD
ncbi:hypothetical protein EMCRGX_G011903 [Ephydatia muelleri]